MIAGSIFSNHLKNGSEIVPTGSLSYLKSDPRREFEPITGSFKDSK